MPLTLAWASMTTAPTLPESSSSVMTAAVLPLAPVEMPCFLNAWSTSAPQVVPVVLIVVGGTMQPVNAAAYGFLQKPVEMPQPANGTFCCAKNGADASVGVSTGTTPKTPSCWTSRLPIVRFWLASSPSLLQSDWKSHFRPFVPPAAFSASKRAFAPTAAVTPVVSQSPATLIELLVTPRTDACAPALPPTDASAAVPTIAVTANTATTLLRLTDSPLLSGLGFPVLAFRSWLSGLGLPVLVFRYPSF